MVFKNLCILVLWMEVALALEGVKHPCLEVYLTSVVWASHTFENNFRMKQKFAKYVIGELYILTHLFWIPHFFASRRF